MAPKMRTVIKNEGKDIVQEHPPAAECHFLHIDGAIISALSHCDEDDIVWRSNKTAVVRYLIVFLNIYISTVTSSTKGKPWRSARFRRDSASCSVRPFKTTTTKLS